MTPMVLAVLLIAMLGIMLFVQGIFVRFAAYVISAPKSSNKIVAIYVISMTTLSLLVGGVLVLMFSSLLAWERACRGRVSSGVTTTLIIIAAIMLLGLIILNLWVTMRAFDVGVLRAICLIVIVNALFGATGGLIGWLGGFHKGTPNKLWKRETLGSRAAPQEINESLSAINFLPA